MNNNREIGKKEMSRKDNNTKRKRGNCQQCQIDDYY